MRSSLQIAQESMPRPIMEIAAEAGLVEEEVELYGRFKAKVDPSILGRLGDRPDGRIVVVTAITPTRAGEGKTTTSVGLTQGLGRVGQRAILIHTVSRSARSVSRSPGEVTASSVRPYSLAPVARTSPPRDWAMSCWP